MCIVLITSGITELPPKKKVVFCSCLTCAYIGNLSKHFYSASEVTYRREHLNLFIGPYWQRICDGNEDITTLVAPLNLNDNHWVIRVGRRKINKLKWTERPVVYFGDSLRYKYTSSTIKFFKAAFDYVFPHSSVDWIMPAENYMLDTVQFKRQRDGYSCEAYVVAACSTFALSSGNLPCITFASGYDAALTEQYRWMSAKCPVFGDSSARLVCWSARLRKRSVLQSR